MIPLSPALLIATAQGFMGVREHGGNNRGQMVELFLAGVKQGPGAPWCAAFVHHAGYWSHFDSAAGRSFWPLPATASCFLLGAFAEQNRVLVDQPQAGDVFLQFNVALARFAHTGIIISVDRVNDRPSGRPWYDCTTIEGNTNEEGSREGNAVVIKKRVFYPDMRDRFIRWVDLDTRTSGFAARHGRAA
jgi:hypothetical protein